MPFCIPPVKQITKTADFIKVAMKGLKMNEKAEIIAQLKYWGYITDWQGAKSLLIRLRLMDEKDFGRAYYRLKEIDFEEEKANRDYKTLKEKENV